MHIFKGYHEPVVTGPNRSGCVRFESVFFFFFESGELQPVRSGLVSVFFWFIEPDLRMLGKLQPVRSGLVWSGFSLFPVHRTEPSNTSEDEAGRYNFLIFYYRILQVLYTVGTMQG